MQHRNRRNAQSSPGPDPSSSAGLGVDPISMSSAGLARAAGLSRRGFLRATGGVAAGAALFGLAGCTGYDSSSTTSTRFSIPDPAARFPEGDVTFRLMDSNDTKAPFWEQFFEAYQKARSNVTCQYDGLPWDRIEEVAPLGIRNGTAHDLMQLPGTIPITQAVEEGWVAPLDDVIPDFEEWKSAFPDGALAPGVHVHDGKLYSVPMASEQRHQALVHFNKRLLDDAGYDPAAEQLSWDEFRAAARTVTERGQGDTYGLALEIGQPGRLSILTRYLARAAGAATASPLGDLDLRTGEHFYDRDEVREAIEFLLALKQDGSILPGANSMLAPEAWPRVVRGNAAMVFGGPWVTVVWENDNPEFEFGVAGHPVPNDDPVPPGYPIFGTDILVMYAESDVQHVAGDVLSYVNSVEGQEAWGEIVGVGNPPINEDARRSIRDRVSDQDRACLELADAMTANPEPVIRNPDTAVVTREQEVLSPSFDDIMQAILVGEETNIGKALSDLKSRADRALDDAISAARKQGADVSRDDYVFPNWDPRVDYTPADYDAL